MTGVTAVTRRTAAIVLALMIMLPAAAWSDNGDIQTLPNCPICGMDRQKFAHSRMLIRYADGSRFGACSLHCAALELAYHPGNRPVEILVGDYHSHRLIDAQKAAWVVGGAKRGVMTANAKWAFARPEDARSFIAQHGGEPADFDAAIRAAFCDMYADTKIIREKRRRMKHTKTHPKE